MARAGDWTFIPIARLRITDRAGRLFTPDIVSMAKGLSSGYLPMSAVGVAGHIVETLRGAGAPFVHGYTCSGHPTCAAVARANLDLIAGEGLVAHAAAGEAGSLGLLAAVEIVAAPGTNRRFGGREGLAGPTVRGACLSRGPIVRAVRDTIVLSPPLVITFEEIDRIAAIIADALDDSAAALAMLDA